MKNINHEIFAADHKYKVLKKYLHAVISIQCPWCLNMTSLIEDTDCECSVCRRIISMEDVEDSYDLT